MGRFNYIKYDEPSMKVQQEFKTLFEAIESRVDTMLADGRAKSLVYTALEEAYMWVGKSVRDTQVLQRSATTNKNRGSNAY